MKTALSFAVALVLLLVVACEEMAPAPPRAPPQPPVEPPPQEPPPPTPRSCPYARDEAPAGFDIEIEWRGTYAEWLVAEVECAAAYWETAILSDLPDFVSEGRFLDAGVKIDDLRVSIAFVDDAPDLWGAPPDVMAITTTVVERAGGLPYYGNIMFRLREARYRTDRRFLYDLARHEIAHAIGFGQSSAFYRLCTNGRLGGRFLGSAVLRGAPPGTAFYVTEGGHWESAGPLVIDIMARIEGGYVTRYTLAAFQDIGYRVDYELVGR